MPTIISTQLKNLSDNEWERLKDAHPDATVQIEIQDVHSGMDELAFWKIIDLLDFGRKSNSDIVASAEQVLSGYAVVDIYRFEDILAEKLHSLDGEAYAKRLGWGEDTFSVDQFLYARCCVVANGRAFYEKVLNAPSQMPVVYTFEPLLYLAEHAYRLKTGRDDYDYLPRVSYETFSNQVGWPQGPYLEDLLKG
ncbi:MAG: DUF4240 domain-containing protein [Saprospiraceae bacterium]|nr:DUF4240 domain-containing protein [Saprospiraceae bacterium]